MCVRARKRREASGWRERGEEERKDGWKMGKEERKKSKKMHI